MTKPFPGAVAPSADDLLTFSQVCDLIGEITGRRPAPSTIFRWVRKGIKGRRLTARRIGGQSFVRRGDAIGWVPDFTMPAAVEEESTAAVSAVLGRKYAGKSPRGKRGAK